MLTSEKTDDRRSAATPEPCEGATYVAEAATAEEALADVHAQLGASARIIEARRLPRGGIGGFFAREAVQIHAAPPATEAAAGAAATPAAAPAAAPVGTPPSPPAGRVSPVDRLLEGADTTDDSVDFATFLRRQIGHADEAEQGLAPGDGPAGQGAERPADPGPTVVRWPRIDEPADVGQDVTGDGDVAVDPDVAVDRDVAGDRDVAADEAVATDQGTEADHGAATDPAVTTAADEPVRAGMVSEVDWAALRALLAEAQRTVAEAERRSAGVGRRTSASVDGAGREAPAPSSSTSETPAASIPDSPAASIPDSPAASSLSGPADLPSAGDPPATEDDGPCWSVTSLLRLGLPQELVRSLTVDEPHDDAAWTMALATALRPLCRPLPAGRSLLIGPRARARANRLQVPVVEAGDPILASGDVAAVVGKGVARREWVVANGTEGRWVHVLAGGSGWRHLLHADPLAVSWASADDLADAIACAAELGLVLGHGPLAGAIRRARPLDMALAVRDLLPRR